MTARISIAEAYASAMKVESRAFLGLTSLIVAAPATTQSPGLREPRMQDVAMRLASAAENSPFDWRARYAYLEHNVGHDAMENRG